MTPLEAGAPPTRGGTTIPAWSTESTVAMMKTMRRMFLDYRNARGESARDLIGERLFDTRSRDAPLVFPYAVMRLQTQNDGINHAMRLTGFLEVQVHGRPWAQQAAVYAVCDLFDQSMVARWMNQTGLIVCHGLQRATLPPGTAPIDSEVITVRLEYTLLMWPQFLTSLSYYLPPTTDSSPTPPAPIELSEDFLGPLTNWIAAPTYVMPVAEGGAGHPSTGGSEIDAAYYDVPTISENQFVRATARAVNGNDAAVAVMARVSDVEPTFYLAALTNVQTTPSVLLCRYDNGVKTVLLSQAYSPLNGASVQLRVTTDGTSALIFVGVNGVTAMATVDPAPIRGGRPGFAVDDGAGNNVYDAQITDWTAGEIV